MLEFTLLELVSGVLQFLPARAVAQPARIDEQKHDDGQPVPVAVRRFVIAEVSDVGQARPSVLESL